MKSLCRKYCRGFFCEKRQWPGHAFSPDGRRCHFVLISGPSTERVQTKIALRADLVNYLRKEKQKLLKRIKNTFDRN